MKKEEYRINGVYLAAGIDIDIRDLIPFVALRLRKRYLEIAISIGQSENYQ